MDLNKIDNASPIIKMLGEERVEKLKDGIMEIILEQVRDDLEHWDTYICYPPDFQDAFSEAYDEIRNKLKKLYKDKALDVAANAVNKFAEEALK